jgi:deoxyribose-phosphate aldolase
MRFIDFGMLKPTDKIKTITQDYNEPHELQVMGQCVNDFFYYYQLTDLK